LQWLQNPSLTNGDNLNNVLCETNGSFRNKRMGAMRDAYSILMGRSEGKRPLRIRMILERILGDRAVDGIHRAQNRDQWLALVNMVMNLRVP